MIKLPKITVEEIMEIKKQVKMGVKYLNIEKEYCTSYYNIKKICKIFESCDCIEDVEEKQNSILEHNEKQGKIIHRINYQIYKEYYNTYNKLRRAKLILKNEVMSDKVKKLLQEKVDYLTKDLLERKKRQKYERSRKKKLADLEKIINPIIDYNSSSESDDSTD